jgi:phosphatidylserine/phosphatidylglycerophosphate/cardiolipin synthase-like enzyme
VFLIELDTRFDPDLRVATLLRELAAAHWRGVDVRLVVGGSRTNLLIAEASAAAIQFARAMGIPSRGFGQTNQRGSHVKLIVADNWILTGSHNWSGGAFGEHVQDSVLVQSAALAAYMANVFFKQWLRARSR